jgi:hypothetical protein
MATHCPVPTFSFNTNTDSAVISAGAMKKIEYASGQRQHAEAERKHGQHADAQRAAQQCIGQRTLKMPLKAPRYSMYAHSSGSELSAHRSHLRAG